MAQYSDLDSRLLNPGQENEAAGKLREEKSSSAKATEDESAGAEAGADDEPRSLRQRVMQARQALNLKEQAKKKIEEKVMAPAKQGTSYLLKAAWLNIIDSFGLTLIYINTHVFLRWVFPDLFCKLGDEWMPKIVAGESSNKNIAGTAFGIIEVIGLLIIDTIILFLILGALTQIVLIVQFMQSSWWEKIVTTFKVFWGTGWDTMKVLYKLFSPFSS